MQQDDQDVTQAENTAPESSTEEQIPEGQEGAQGAADQEGEEEQRVPLSRFNHVMGKLKDAEELLEIYQKNPGQPASVKVEPALEKSAADFNSVEGWQRYIAQETAKAAEGAEKRARESLRRDYELQELQKMDDFPALSGAIKAEVARNPSLSPLDAYHIARSKNPVLSRKKEQAIEQRVKKQAIAKQKAQVGGSPTRGPVTTISADDIYAKDEKGNFKYSLDQIKEMSKGNK